MQKSKCTYYIHVNPLTKNICKYGKFQLKCLQDEIEDEYGYYQIYDGLEIEDLKTAIKNQNLVITFIEHVQLVEITKLMITNLHTKLPTCYSEQISVHKLDLLINTYKDKALQCIVDYPHLYIPTIICSSQKEKLDIINKYSAISSFNRIY